MRKRGASYSDAIDKVREAHLAAKPDNLTVECPMCGLKQLITNTPGMRRCMKCGHEFKGAPR